VERLWSTHSYHTQAEARPDDAGASAKPGCAYDYHDTSGAEASRLTAHGCFAQKLEIRKSKFETIRQKSEIETETAVMPAG
jgi:hypothetical protein